MSDSRIEPRPGEVPLFMIGMWLIPSIFGYIIVGVLIAVDVLRWLILLLEWIERRRRPRTIKVGKPAKSHDQPWQ